VFFELAVTGAFFGAEHAFGMLFADVGLELGGGGEGEEFGAAVFVEHEGYCAGGADELRRAVESFYMLAETNSTVKSSIARFFGNWVDVCARVGGEFKMIGSNMALESLMLAEALMAARISCTSESIMALMSLFVSSKSCTR